jgi:hypothetical protein
VPRLVTESGIVSEVKEEHWEKALSPTVCTDCPIVIDFSVEQPKNAP